MTYLEAIILGLVQGIAEFLPISSSGHLKLFEKLLGLPNVETDYILFDVLLHFGTLVAVLIVYHRVIADLLREALTMVHIRTPRAGETPDRPKRRMIALLIASLLPLFLILPVKDAMEKLGSSYLFIGIMLMITGLVLYMSDHFPKGEKTEKEMTLWDALLVGLGKRLPKVPIGIVEILLWAVVLLTGWLLGGPVGIGTVISTFGGGLVMQAVYSAIRFEPRKLRHKDIVQTIQQI